MLSSLLFSVFLFSFILFSPVPRALGWVRPRPRRPAGPRSEAWWASGAGLRCARTLLWGTEEGCGAAPALGGTHRCGWRCAAACSTRNAHTPSRAAHPWRTCMQPAAVLAVKAWVAGLHLRPARPMLPLPLSFRPRARCSVRLPAWDMKTGRRDARVVRGRLCETSRGVR